MRRISALGFLVFAAACSTDGPNSVTSPANVGEVRTATQHGGGHNGPGAQGGHNGPGAQGGQHGGGVQIAATCTPAILITEGNLFPGGLTEFVVTGGSGEVRIDANNAGTGLQSLTVVGTPTNAVVTIPAFTPGTKGIVVVTFTVPNPSQAVSFNLRAASTFHAANIQASCAAPCTPTLTNTEGNLAPGGLASFGVTSGPGSVTVDHVNAGTGLQSLTVVGTPVNAVVTIPPFTPGTFSPVTVTFTAINPALAVDFTLRAASTFHALNSRAQCPATTNGA